MAIKPQSILSILIVCTVLSSCDCYVEVKGQVISTSTGDPISNVHIEIVDRGIETKTDLYGRFAVSEQTGFCYDPKVKLSKKGFKPFLIILSSDHEWNDYSVFNKTKTYHLEPSVKIGHDTEINSTYINLYSAQFYVRSDSIIFYLDEDNKEKELEDIRNKLKEQSIN